AIPQELADAPYMTVYEFLTLPDEARPAALEVVRAQPEAPRKALVAFKRARKAPRATPERDALLAELDQLAVRTAEIERRLAEIDGRGLVAVGLGIRR
ncbi:MAG TPA: hypothetical protein VEB64_16470, partial [Azospirillaceae bacterium]|nr:hypothetical protein [Azospirillaceae bacterium]